MDTQTVAGTTLNKVPVIANPNLLRKSLALYLWKLLNLKCVFVFNEDFYSSLREYFGLFLFRTSLLQIKDKNRILETISLLLFGYFL